MPKGTFGAFKGLHNGYGIYWDGCYNIEGNGEYQTKTEAAQAIDAHIARLKEKDLAERKEKAASGRYLVVLPNGEGRKVRTPNGIVEFSTMRQFRQRIFDLEDQFGMESVSLSDVPEATNAAS